MNLRTENSGRTVRPFIPFTILIIITAVSVSGCFSGRKLVHLPPSAPEVLSSSGLPPLILTFAGDIMAHDVNFNRPPYGNIYEGVGNFLWSDDLSFGNLEFPVRIDRPMSNYPAFNTHPAYVEAAIHGGFDVFSCANNHSTDQDAAGVASTLSVIEELSENYGTAFSGLADPPGSGITAAAVEHRGWRIGFIAVTEFLNSYRGAAGVHVVDYHDKEAKDEFLGYLAEAAAEYDLLIVSVHGGREYSRVPTEEKVRFFDELLAHGVHIVWGHHPHVLQPWMTKHVNGTSRLILYSTGNFISGQAWKLDPYGRSASRIHTVYSALFRVNVVNGKNGPAVAAVTPIPIANYRHKDYGMIVRPLAELSRGSGIAPEWTEFYRNLYIETSIITGNAGHWNIVP